MSDTYHNTKIWHGLPKSGRKRARSDMGPVAGVSVKTSIVEMKHSHVPPEQRSPRPDGKPKGSFRAA